MLKQGKNVRQPLLDKQSTTGLNLDVPQGQLGELGYVSPGINQRQRKLVPRPELSQDHCAFVERLCKRVAASHLIGKATQNCGQCSSLKSTEPRTKKSSMMLEMEPLDLSKVGASGVEDDPEAEDKAKKKKSLRLGDITSTRAWLEEALISSCDEASLDEMQQTLQIENLSGEMTLTEVLVAIPKRATKNFLAASMNEPRDLRVAIEVVETGFATHWRDDLLEMAHDLIMLLSPCHSIKVWKALGSLCVKLGEKLSASEALEFEYWAWPVSEKAQLLSSMEESDAAKLLADYGCNDKQKILNKIHYGEDALPYEMDELIDGLRDDLIDDAYVRSRYGKGIRMTMECPHDPDALLAYVSHRGEIRLQDESRYHTETEAWVKALELDAHTTIKEEAEVNSDGDEDGESEPDDSSAAAEPEHAENAYNKKALSRQFNELALSHELVYYRRSIDQDAAGGDAASAQGDDDNKDKEPKYKYELVCCAHMPQLINPIQHKHARYNHLNVNHDKRTFFFNRIPNEGHVAMRVAFNILDTERFCSLIDEKPFGETKHVDYRAATETWEIPFDTPLYQNFVDHFHEEVDKKAIRESHMEPTFLQQGDLTVLVFPTECSKEKKDYLNFYALHTGDCLLKVENAWNLLDFHNGALSLIAKDAKAVCSVPMDFSCEAGEQLVVLNVPPKMDTVQKENDITMTPMLNGPFQVIHKKKAMPLERDEDGRITKFEYFLRELQRDKEENEKKMKFNLVNNGSAFKKEGEELQNDIASKKDDLRKQLQPDDVHLPCHQNKTIYNYPFFAMHQWTPQLNQIVVYQLANKRMPPLMLNLLNDRFVCFVDTEPGEYQGLHILCERDGHYALHRLLFTKSPFQHAVLNRANPIEIETEHLGYVNFEPLETHKVMKAARIKRFIVLQTHDNVYQAPIKPGLNVLEEEENKSKSLLDGDGAMMRKLKMILSYRALFFVQADKYNSNDEVVQVMFDEQAKQLNVRKNYKAVGGRFLAMETELEDIDNERRNDSRHDRLLLIDDKLNLIHLDFTVAIEDQHHREGYVHDIKTGRGLDGHLNGWKHSAFKTLTWLQQTMCTGPSYWDTVNGFRVYMRSLEYVRDEIHGGETQSLRLSKNVLQLISSYSEQQIKISRHAATRTRSFIEDLKPMRVRHAGFIGDELCIVQTVRKKNPRDTVEQREWIMLDINSQIVRMEHDLSKYLREYDEAFDKFFEERRLHNEQLAQNPSIGEFKRPGKWHGSRFKRLNNGKYHLSLGMGPTIRVLTFHTNGQLQKDQLLELSGKLHEPELMVFTDGTHLLIEFEERALEEDGLSGGDKTHQPREYHKLTSLKKEGDVIAATVAHYSSQTTYDTNRECEWIVGSSEANLLKKTLAVRVDDFLVWHRLDTMAFHVLHKDDFLGGNLKEDDRINNIFRYDLSAISRYEHKRPQEIRLNQPPIICARYFSQFIRKDEKLHGLNLRHSILQVTQDKGHTLFHLERQKDDHGVLLTKAYEIYTEDRETEKQLDPESIVQPIRGNVRYFANPSQNRFLQQRLISCKNMSFSILQKRIGLLETSQLTYAFKQYSEMNYLFLKKVIQHCDDLQHKMDKINPRMFATAYNNQSIFTVLLSNATVFPKTMEQLIKDVQQQNFEMESGRTDDLTIDDAMKRQIFSILSYNCCCTNLNLDELVQESGEADGDDEDPNKTSVMALKDRGSISLLQLSPHLKNLRSKELIYTLANMFDQTSLSHLATNLKDFYAMLANSSTNSNELVEQSFSSTSFTDKIDTIEWKASAKSAVFRAPTYMLDRETCRKEVQDYFARHQIEGEDALESVKVSMLDLQWLFSEGNYFSELVQTISASKDRQIFATEFIQIMLSEFWDQNYTVIFYSCFLPFLAYLITFILMLVGALNIEKSLQAGANEESLHGQMLATDILGYVSLALLALTVYTEISQMEEGICDYLSSFYNVMDVVSICLNVPLTILAVSHSRLMGNTYVVGCASLAVLILWFRIYDWLRLFQYTAFYAKLVVETLGDIMKFLIVFLITLMTIGNALFILNYAGSDVVSPVFGNWFIDTFTNQWLLTVGEYALDDFEQNSLKATCYLLFFLGTFLTQVTFLNMLVAIMGDTFERVTESKDLYSAQNQLQIMADYSLILRKRATRLDNRYMFIVQPMEDNQSDLGVWDGNLASMKRAFQQQLNLMALKQDRKQQAAMGKIEEKLVTVQNKIDGMSGVEAIVKAIVGKIDNLQEDTEGQITDLKKNLGVDAHEKKADNEEGEAHVHENVAIGNLQAKIDSLSENVGKVGPTVEAILEEIKSK